jgi:hypothetical protein
MKIFNMFKPVKSVLRKFKLERFMMRRIEKKNDLMGFLDENRGGKSSGAHF